MVEALLGSAEKSMKARLLDDDEVKALEAKAERSEDDEDDHEDEDQVATHPRARH